MMEDSPEVNFPTVGVAARHGAQAVLQDLLSQDRPVDVADNRGFRPTHEAVSGGYYDCLKLLLEQEATDVNWQTHEDKTALYMAAEAGSRDMTALLLQHKADPNLADYMSDTPLLAAVRSKNTACIKMLVEHGANVNGQLYTGTTALHEAAQEGLRDVVEYLLHKGAKISIREEYGLTPIFTAAQYGQTECLELLLKSKQAIEDGVLWLNWPADDGATPLFLASQEGHYDCAKLLLDYGASANQMACEPFSLPLHAALQFNRLKCVKLLLGVTSESCFDQSIGYVASPFEFAFMHDDGKATKLLLENGFKPNQRFKLQRGEEFESRVLQGLFHCVHYSRRLSSLTNLIYFRGNMKHAKILLEAGASVNASTKLELPPLLAALNNCNIDFTRMLISRGARVNLRHRRIAGNVTLVVALHFWKGMKLLLKCGAKSRSLFTTHYDDLHPEPERPHNQNIPDRDLYSVYEMEESPSSDDSGTEGLEQGYSSMVDHKPLCLPQILHSARDILSRLDYKVDQVLHMLLMFTTNVSLDPRLKPLMDSEQRWKALLETTENPKSLMHYSRHVIRSALGSQNLYNEDFVRQSVPLPPQLLDYLLYVDV